MQMVLIEYFFDRGELWKFEGLQIVIGEDKLPYLQLSKINMFIAIFA